jgi:hypothetical protein
VTTTQHPMYEQLVQALCQMMLAGDGSSSLNFNVDNLISDFDIDGIVTIKEPHIILVEPV